MSLNFCFIGAGNLASHLSKALQIEGYFVSQVYSRTEKSAKELAEILSTKYVTTAKDVDKDADIYIIALKDSAFDKVLSQINFQNKLVVHCSGSLPLSVLRKYSNNTGVFYPLQTFSKSRYIDFKDLPVFIEANTEKNENLLLELASQISNSVTVLNSEKRKILHLSAVFACNFVNYLYSVSAEILKSKDISFDVLKPLILETAQKVQKMDPDMAQTGPAIRFDENIISSQLNELEGFLNYQELYNLISRSIFEHHKNKE